ncbi:thymidylate kinase [Aciduliprofundum sp. MAR08-339]|uniref:P-loop NTPase fold protein n=1 Tax=Aciduliprofundum sp. (strain MAR08-339) TaxID=673860 RepID=UPI0002A4790B|nr:thymidylate kinase [Aciduliprofundum sp. MAR08-339]
MRNFTISLLGIDGAGKSTLSKRLKEELEKKGYRVRIVPFHYWVFADKLKMKYWKVVDKDRETVLKPYEPKPFSLSAILKPIIALMDNILFYISTQPDGKRWNVVIYDRFICATQIKLKALGYHVEWLRPIWENFKTDYCFIIDISEEESIKRQINREDPYTYRKQQLKIERYEYVKFAKKHNCIILEGKNSVGKNIKVIMEVFKNA